MSNEQYFLGCMLMIWLLFCTFAKILFMQL